MSDHNEKIERFILGEMNPEELLAFEKDMENDPALKKEYLAYRQLIDGLTDTFQNQKKVDDFKNTLQSVKAEIDQTSNTPETKVVPIKKNNWKIILGVAAAIALFGMMFWLVVPPKSLYKKYAHLPQANLTEMSSAGSNDTFLARADHEFNSGQYDKALLSLNAYFENSPEKPDRKLLIKGICLLELNQLAEAERVFQDIAQSDQKSFQNEANYYLALTYLKQKNWEKTRIALEKIPKSSAKNKYAIELLKEIKNK